MFKEPLRRLHRCYISAPYGIDLGSLPVLLGERQIGWNWASEDVPGELGYVKGIERCDFVLAVLDGTKSDHRVLYEMGIGEGLGKPIFVVALNKRVNSFAMSKFSIATVGLGEAAALAFQLDLFLSTPHETIFTRELPSPSHARPVVPKIERSGAGAARGSALEQRVYEIIIGAGGSAIVEPKDDAGAAAPDLLMWLPHQEPSLLDPAVIEVKLSGTHQIARTVERRLLSFMQAGGVQSALLLTADEPVPRFRSIAPNFFWLSVDDFERLILEGHLGFHLRGMRNRAAHGAP
ncbi:hypothetical protein ASC97_07635 [Rhizobium sp. Root1203]|jgi:hypothetical protein|uniref:nucleoside 2-deoxyribosyltransferase n=1 Tax=Rhizobium sp. Root1203 TaxID=1736427 RepID=UPI000709F9BE|nr:nucleoside 2-deoxyribosyltransferase [Rhizobium sp. Root1203]KQV28202.1 hypothetical protein ASC97_07635 [Rhizobium sp. Root1203]